MPILLLLAQVTVGQLAGRPDIQRALAAIDRLHAQTIQDQIALTEIPAPPFMEQRRAGHFAGLLRAAGADSVWIDEVGNVLGLRRGTARDHTLVLSGHLDTVFPEGTDVTVRVAGDTLYAPGVADDTRGLVVVLTVLRALEAASVQTAGDILFVGTVGEEGLGDLRGVKHLFRPGGPRIDAFVSVDGSNAARLVHQALGSHRYRVTFQGPGGHSWGDFGMANPHHALAAAIERFVAAADAYTREGPRTSYSVGRIGGGTSVNSIPFESWMEVDMRSEDPARLAGVDSLFQRAMHEGLAAHNALRRDGDALTMTIEMVGDRPPGSIPRDQPFIAWTADVIRHLGMEPAFGRSSTDANIPISRGVPAVTLGGGGVSQGSHSLGEYWIDRDSDVGIRLALLIAAGAAGR